MNTGQNGADGGTTTSSSVKSSRAMRGAAHSAHGWCTAWVAGSRSAYSAPTSSISGAIAKRVRSRSVCPKW